MMSVVPIVPSDGESGNTVLTLPKQASPCYNWVFTLNNPSDEEIEAVKQVAFQSSKVMVFQKEEGEEGTPHLQGYVSLQVKRRLTGMKELIPRAHFERCRNKKASIAYCMKTDGRLEEPFVHGIRIKKKVKDPLEGKELYPFQKKVLTILESEPDDRSIYWFWEDVGNTGKSALCKHLVLKYGDDITVVNGKQGDMFNNILSHNERKGDYPTIVIVDIPRCMSEYISWGGLEKIKDGLLYSGKYEGGLCVFNCPHMICFANTPPDRSRLSLDRWIIEEITPASVSRG